MELVQLQGLPVLGAPAANPIDYSIDLEAFGFGPPMGMPSMHAPPAG